MAGVPCVNDTCGIVSTVDANGRLNLDVRLDPAGGLVCNDGAGLAIQSQGSHIVTAFSEDRVSMAVAGQIADLNLSITNGTGVHLMAVITAKYDFRFNYLADNNPGGSDPVADVNDVNDVINNRYFSFDLTNSILLNGAQITPGGSGLAMTIDGIGPQNSAGSDDRSKGSSLSTVVTIPSGAPQTLTLRSNRSAAGGASQGTLDFASPNYGMLRSARVALLRSASSGAGIVIV